MSTRNILDFSKIKVTCANCNLSELCLPRGLGNEDMQKLEKVVKQSRPVQAGEYLYRAGDPFRSLYAMRSGSAKVFITDDNGDEQILGFYFPGEILGLDAIEHERFNCSAVALETSTYCSFPYNGLHEICQAIPELQKQLFKFMSKELSQDNELLLTIGKRNAEERIATFLITLSSRFQRLGYSSKEFKLAMSRQEIGNYLGLTIETVSRVLSRFHKEGYIHITRKQVRLDDQDALRAMCGKCLGHADNHPRTA